MYKEKITKNLFKWRPVFAWFPVVVHEDEKFYIVWLKQVFVRSMKYCDLNEYTDNIFELLKEDW